MSKYAEDKEGLQIGAKCWVENLTRRQVKTNINNKESGPGNDLLQYTFYKCSLYISA